MISNCSVFQSWAEEKLNITYHRYNCKKGGAESVSRGREFWSWAPEERTICLGPHTTGMISHSGPMPSPGASHTYALSVWVLTLLVWFHTQAHCLHQEHHALMVHLSGSSHYWYDFTLAFTRSITHWWFICLGPHSAGMISHSGPLPSPGASHTDGSSVWVLTLLVWFHTQAHCLHQEHHALMVHLSGSSQCWYDFTLRPTAFTRSITHSCFICLGPHTTGMISHSGPLPSPGASRTDGSSVWVLTLLVWFHTQAHCLHQEHHALMLYLSGSSQCWYDFTLRPTAFTRSITHWWFICLGPHSAGMISHSGPLPSPGASRTDGSSVWVLTVLVWFHTQAQCLHQEHHALMVHLSGSSQCWYDFTLRPNAFTRSITHWELRAGASITLLLPLYVSHTHLYVRTHVHIQTRMHTYI